MRDSLFDSIDNEGLLNEGVTKETNRRRGRLDRYDAMRPPSPNSTRKSRRRQSSRRLFSNKIFTYTGQIRIQNRFYNVIMNAFNTSTDAFEIVIQDYEKNIEWAACVDCTTSFFNYIYQALLQNEHTLTIGFLNVKYPLPFDLDQFEPFDDRQHTMEKTITQRIITRIRNKGRSKHVASMKKKRRMSIQSISSFDSLSTISFTTQKTDEVWLELWPRLKSSSIVWMTKNPNEILTNKDGSLLPLLYISPNQRSIISLTQTRSIKIQSTMTWIDGLHLYSVRLECDPLLHSLRIGFIETSKQHMIDTSHPYKQNGKSFLFQKFDIITLFADLTQRKLFILVNGIPISSSIRIRKATPFIELKPQANISIVHDDRVNLLDVLSEFHPQDEVAMLLECTYTLGSKKKCIIS